jgi:Rrf2 family protein
MLSKTCEYGVKATIYIALQSMSGQRTSLKYITKEIDSPEAFTAKILQKLAKANIVESIKGLNGGFEISEEKRKNTMLSEIVFALDGDDIASRCFLGLPQCSHLNPCSVHNKYKPIRENLLQLIHNTTIEEMALGIKTKNAILK